MRGIWSRFIEWKLRQHSLEQANEDLLHDLKVRGFLVQKRAEALSRAALQLYLYVKHRVAESSQETTH